MVQANSKKGLSGDLAFGMAHNHLLIASTDIIKFMMLLMLVLNILFLNTVQCYWN